MVDIIRRKNVDVVSPDVSSGMKATANMVSTIGKGIGSAIESYGKKLEKEELKADADYRKQVEKNIISEQKAFDAADKLVAADMAGRLKNDLLRWNLEQRQNNPNFIGTAEHEKRMRDEYARLANKYGVGLGEAGRAEFTTKTQSAVNEFIGNDVKWAYQQKLKQGEKSAQTIAETMNQNAKLYGANGDVEGFKEAHKENRKNLKEYAETAMPAGAGQALNELDTKSINQFISGLAQTNPEQAKAIMDSMERFKEIVPDETLQDISNQKRIADQQRLSDEIIILNAGIANSKDKKEQKKLTKARDARKKELDKIGDKDYEAESLAELHKQVSDSVGKEIDYQLNLHKKQQEEAIAAQKLDNALAFMDNPILYRANLDRAFPKSGMENVKGRDILLGKESDVFEAEKELDKKASEIYSLSDKVGDGKVDPATLQLIVRQVASITADDKTGVIDDNILKAYDADIALRKAGASPEQLQTYHKLAQIAMTDTNFKQSVAALANKPDFNTMFLDKQARYTGLRSLFRKAKDDDTDYVEDLGRQAYMGAMNYMVQGRPEDALRYYDDKVAEAYDYIKRDVIDVDYVKRELAKTGSAMVELNGRMTKITGRLPNGEYIIESTGEKVNGNF